jgi:SAM-dependent methyltransferase
MGVRADFLKLRDPLRRRDPGGRHDVNAKTELDLVAKQYTAWCYPRPVPDLAAHAREGVYDASDPSLFRRRLWPRRTERDDLDILIAGCGTYQAAFYAFMNPHCRVTGIDLSETSLQHHLYLKERHELSNLTLCQMNLLDVASLRQTFDYVVSTGVLHHLQDPDAGLRVLKSVLRPNGVMSVMVYGRYNRAGVYMLKDAFHRAGLQQDARSLDVIKATLAALPPWHHARSYLVTAPDLGYDSGLVDTFLHPVDRPYRTFFSWYGAPASPSRVGWTRASTRSRRRCRARILCAFARVRCRKKNNGPSQSSSLNGSRAIASSRVIRSGP